MLQPGRNIASLTGLRGLAALAVVFHHASSEATQTSLFRGQPMVDIFFALSGFVMSYVYLARGPLDWMAFARSRFARIYPLHAATALAMAAASLAVARLTHAPWPDYLSPVQALREATLTMAMPLVGADKLWNFPAWSISVEWWTYFTLFPLLVYFGPRLTNRQALALFLIAAIALAVLLHLDLAKATRGWPAFGRALVGFGGGWVAHRFAASTNRALSPPMADAVALGVLACIYGTAPITGDDAWYLLPVYPVLVFALATTPTSASARFLSWRPVERLGEISFSIYLVHSIVLDVFKQVSAKIVPLTGQAEWIAVMVPATLLVAPVSYYLLEMPMRRLLSPRKPARTAP